VKIKRSSKCADKNGFPLEFDKEDFDTIKNKPEILSVYEKVENLAGLVQKIEV